VAGAGIGAGFEKDEIEYYDTSVRNGRTLVTVHDDDGRSESIFDETGAERYRRPSTGTTRTI
jgi:hypothetical protein